MCFNWYFDNLKKKKEYSRIAYIMRSSTKLIKQTIQQININKFSKQIKLTYINEKYV